LPRDPAEATRRLRECADAGYASGQASYGYCLLTCQGIAKNAGEAVQWFQKAAAQANALGQYCLGICFADGLGTKKNFDEARKWLSLAADQEWSDARYRLRLLFFQKHGILKWEYAFTSVVGTALLVFHGLHTPISVNGFAIAAFLGVLVGSGVAFLLLMALLERFGLARPDENEAQDVNERIQSSVKKEPWRLLLIPAEDGFFLLPLLYVGITPISAAIAAALFAAAHYPSFPWRYCIPKGVAYFFIALFVLPAGIWSVVIAHLIIDLTAIGFGMISELDTRPASRRLLRLLKSD